MEYERTFFEIAFPAFTALAGVLIALLVQGIIERNKRQHDSIIGKRVPLTAACEQLSELLESQMYAIVTIEAMLQHGFDVSKDEKLGVLLKKEYRKKLWVIVENPEMLGAINSFATKVENISGKLISNQRDDQVMKEVQESRNALGVALKTLTKHTASIWGLSLPVDK